MALIPIRIDRTSKPPLGTPLRTDGHWSVQMLMLAVDPANPINLVTGEWPIRAGSTLPAPSTISDGSSALFTTGYYRYNKSNIPNKNGKFTLFCRQLWSGSATSYQVPIGIGQDLSWYAPDGSTGRVSFDTIPGGTRALSNSGVITATNIQSLALTWDGATPAISGYINGVTDRIDNLPTGSWVEGEALYVGMGQNNEFCKSSLSIALIYNNTLSPLQVASLSANPWQIYDPETVWIEIGGAGGATTRDLVAALAASSTTGAVTAQMVRTLLANLSGSSATSTAAATIIRGLVASIAGSSASSTASAAIIRGLIANLSASSSSSAPLVTLSRALVAAVVGASTTPTITATISGLINLVAAISGASATPDSVIATTARLLASAISGSSTTPTVTASMSGLISLIAALSATSSTGTVLASLQRNIQAAIAGASTTPAITGTLANILNLVAALSNTSNTGAISATLQRELMVMVAAASSTGAISATTARSMQAVITAQSLTPDNVGMVLGVLGTIINTSIESATIIRAIESLTKKYTIH
jgi:hypothetical protein